MSWNSCDVEKHVYLSRAKVARSDEHQSIGDEDMGLGKGWIDLMMLRRMRRKNKEWWYDLYDDVWAHGPKRQSQIYEKKMLFINCVQLQVIMWFKIMRPIEAVLPPAALAWWQIDSPPNFFSFCCFSLESFNTRPTYLLSYNVQVQHLVKVPVILTNEAWKW